MISRLCGPAATKTWRDELHGSLASSGEGPGDVVAMVPPDYDLDAPFLDYHGAPDARPLRVWTRNRVYFLVAYDGRKDIVSLPRNPSDEPPQFIGG